MTADDLNRTINRVNRYLKSFENVYFENGTAAVTPIANLPLFKILDTLSSRQSVFSLTEPLLEVYGKLTGLQNHLLAFPLHGLSAPTFAALSLIEEVNRRLDVLEAAWREPAESVIIESFNRRRTYERKINHEGTDFTEEALAQHLAQNFAGPMDLLSESEYPNHGESRCTFAQSYSWNDYSTTLSFTTEEPCFRVKNAGRFAVEIGTAYQILPYKIPDGTDTSGSGSTADDPLVEIFKKALHFIEVFDCTILYSDHGGTYTGAACDSPYSGPYLAFTESELPDAITFSEAFSDVDYRTEIFKLEPGESFEKVLFTADVSMLTESVLTQFFDVKITSSVYSFWRPFVD